MELEDQNQTYELKKHCRRHVEALINFIGMEQNKIYELQTVMDTSSVEKKIQLLSKMLKDKQRENDTLSKRILSTENKKDLQ